MNSDGDIYIRSFSIEDYDDVIKLWGLSGLTIKASDSLIEIEKLCAVNPHGILVAEARVDGAANRIVGAVIGAFDGRRAWIYHLAVLPEVRGVGLGKRLIGEIEQRLRDTGALKVNLLVEPGNENAAGFYRSLGYSEVPLVFFTREL